MKKVFVYKMDAGLVGTEETFTVVDEKPLPDDVAWEYATDHAMSYGNEQDEDEEWEHGQPECWLASTVTTLAELEEVSGYLMYGTMQLEDLVKSLEKEGMVFTK